MFKIKAVIRNGLKLSVGLALSLTVLSSFGELVGPYETVRLNHLSIEGRIKAVNAQVQASSEISEDIKVLVAQYTENVTKCSEVDDYESFGVEARINAFLGVRAFEMATGDDSQKKAEFFQLMADINENLNHNICGPISNDHYVTYSETVHIQALASALHRQREISSFEEFQREKRNWAEFLNIDENFTKLEVVPVRRHL